jgi:hypothetical protein
MTFLNSKSCGFHWKKSNLFTPESDSPTIYLKSRERALNRQFGNELLRISLKRRLEHKMGNVTLQKDDFTFQMKVNVKF